MDAHEEALQGQPRPTIEQAEWFFRHLYDHLRDGGTFRSLIYGRLGYPRGESYFPLYRSGAFAVSNALQDGDDGVDVEIPEALSGCQHFEDGRCMADHAVALGCDSYRAFGPHEGKCNKAECDGEDCEYAESPRCPGPLECLDLPAKP